MTRTEPEPEAPKVHDLVVIGAGPAGLAVAATLKREGLAPLVLERSSVGESWRNHYERLHLHTVRSFSNLPGLAIDKREGRWVSRDGVVRYLERYASHHGLNVRPGVDVRKVERSEDGWRLETGGEPIHGRTVVVATGHNREPFLPDWPGRESFTGELLHSAQYRNAEPYRGRDVLVVGTGNSGAEIAVDLVEGGAGSVDISVRTPPNIMRREVGGLPSQLVGMSIRHLPAGLVDRMARGMQKLTVGDLRPYGVPAPKEGVYTRVKRDSVPIIDVGLIRLLKKGLVRGVPAVTGFDGPEVILADDSRRRPDAVIAATGFLRALDGLVGHLGLVGDSGRPIVHGARIHPKAPGLYFIGFTNPISGNLRELGIDARRIARAVKARSRRARV